MINLPPQVLAQMMQQLQGGQRPGAAAPNGVPISFANSGGASPPMGVSGGAGGGLGAQNMGAGTGVGGGINGVASPGGSTAGLNRTVGATAGGNRSGLGSEGSIQGGEAGQMQNPQMQNRSNDLSVLSDLTSGVGPPLGTSGYGMATQGNVGNPASGQGAFDVGGLGTGMPTSGGLGPGNASIGRDISQLIAPGDKQHMGRTVPKRPANNSLDVSKVFPQTGLQPYRGVLG